MKETDKGMIFKELGHRSSDVTDASEIRKLVSFVDDVQTSAKHHLKRIMAQMPEYDLHDVDHANAVLRNIEDLLGPTVIGSLTSCELTLLYLSTYMHDTGMALPDWDLKVLAAIERIKTSDSDWRDAFFNEFSTLISLADAQNLIRKNAKLIYGDFKSVSKWDFAPETENALIRDLSLLVRDYQDFRNGYSKELRKLSGKILANKNNQLRYEFIRKTHAHRSAKYAANLGLKLKASIGKNWAFAFAKDLGHVCQAHVEEFEKLARLQSLAPYFGEETANLQFIASLLRIADIMHFSFDRAPNILSSEIDFKDPVSFAHWAIKQEGVNYSVKVDPKKREKQISFDAYCQEPINYYELNDYLDWVEIEIGFYLRLFRQWKRDHASLAERWEIILHENVNRSGIRYDETCFTPVRNMSFSLEQKRIIELLMGVGLYKDEFACLRELYQNSLDACRCMLAAKEGTSKGYIEFGIERINGAKYLYCLDRGVGMTKEIIEQHLLHIGSSYYTSRNFERKLAEWGTPFTPVSQFGIGILSCFMLGDQIEITTKPTSKLYQNITSVKCAIDGPHEHFYYMPPDDLDLEKIGEHGTLLRIRLKDGVKIFDDHLSKLWFLYFAERVVPSYRNTAGEEFEGFNENIHKIVSGFVALPPENIEVYVRFNDDSCARIIRYDEAFKWSDFSIDNASVRDLHEYSKQYAIPLFDIDAELNGWVESYKFSVSLDGINFSWNLALPLPLFPEEISLSKYKVVPTYGSEGLFIDGISAKGGENWQDDYLTNLKQIGHLNFTDSLRPQLSVDRRDVISFSNEVCNAIDILMEKVVRETVEKVLLHLSNKNLKSSDPRVLMIWGYIINMFWSSKPLLLEILVTDFRFHKISLLELSALTGDSFVTLGKYLENDLNLSGFSFKELSFIGRILVSGKCYAASSIVVCDEVLLVKGLGFSYYDDRKSREEFELSQTLFCADEWKGKFSEYDIVSSIWPIIPQTLLDRLKSTKHNDAVVHNDRAIEINKSSNGINAIAEQDPVMVHPQHGMYRVEKTASAFRKKEEVCCVNRFEKLENNFWLFDINGHWHADDNSPLYVLYTYVAPRELSEKESIELKTFEQDLPEYVEGVRSGWSLLFLGREKMTPIIQTGIQTRKHMVDLIDSSLWNTTISQKDYRFINGDPLVNYRKKCSCHT